MNTYIASLLLSTPANNGPSPGEPPAPGMVLVYFDLRSQNQTVNTAARVGYVKYTDSKIPIELGDFNIAVGDLVTFAKRKAAGERPADEFPIVWLYDSDHIPPVNDETAVYYVKCLDAALDENSGRFNVPPLSGGRLSYSLSYLLKLYRDSNE